MQVTIFSARPYEKEFLEKEAPRHHSLKWVQEPLSLQTTSQALGSEAVCLFTQDDASANVLEKLQAMGIKYIALRCAGHDNVDLAKAETLGIRVANVPSYSPYAIAEHAATLLMALNRKVVLAQTQIQANNFSLDNLVGEELHGKTVGIIGMGKTGKAFAYIMLGFGCRVLAYDIVPPDLQKRNLFFVSQEEVFTQSDVISLHLPLNASTQHLINAATLFKLKKGAILLNTSRGGLINTVDLIAALKSGAVGAAGLDVYEHERGIFFQDHSGETLQDSLFEELRNLPNVLLTGHQAFLTRTALRNIADATHLSLDQWEKGEASANELIPKLEAVSY
ncbi:2-hydroxyacid dehydrogenase [Rufibacter latericius]|uniref:2-hydroxyacid dehydrogenase n=1 Tax=Rufibacter latericius TaxID=2487040 RepID=A0A3M9MAI4_9BACT|nr:2-hydroxyacid dehydrogenase [Rufibacter latericius]RNI22572.1 2-hydroxyacid dehydrogenase [Rufibacter latericius]